MYFTSLWNYIVYSSKANWVWTSPSPGQKLRRTIEVHTTTITHNLLQSEVPVNLSKSTLRAWQVESVLFRFLLLRWTLLRMTPGRILRSMRPGRAEHYFSVDVSCLHLRHNMHRENPGQTKGVQSRINCWFWKATQCSMNVRPLWKNIRSVPL